MTDPVYGTADLGLIMGTTNDDLFNEEMTKEPGLRALAKVFACKSKTCTLTARQHLQQIVPSIDALRTSADFVKDHEDKSREELVEMMGAEGRRKMREHLGEVLSVAEPVMMRIGPDGSAEAVPLNEAPAHIRAELKAQIEADEGLPDEIKQRVLASLGETPVGPLH
jgi:hypothetical protein